MITKNKIKLIASLKEKKFREAENLFLIEGEKICIEALSSDWEVVEVILTNNYEPGEQLANLIKKRKIEVNRINEKDYKKISNEKTPPGCSALIKIKKYDLEKDLIENKLDKVILLEQINDPGNLGTIIRTADWFNFSGIILSENSCDVFNPKVVKGSMGSLFHLKIYENINLINSIEILRNYGFLIIGTDLKGLDIKKLKKRDKIAVIFGNESHGLSLNTKNQCDEIVTIPKSGSSESLNVAISASIIMYELSN